MVCFSPKRFCAVLHFIVSYYIVLYCILSHALKNTANQRPGLPLHILRYAPGIRKG